MRKDHPNGPGLKGPGGSDRVRFKFDSIISLKNQRPLSWGHVTSNSVFFHTTVLNPLTLQVLYSYGVYLDISPYVYDISLK